MVCLCVIDLAKKIAEKCVEPIVGYVQTEVGYLWNYKANIEKLSVEVVNINAETTSMKDRIEAENRSGKTKVDARADYFVKMMTSLNDEADRIIKEEARETERCLMGLRPNLLACYRASKSAMKVMDSANELKEDGKQIETVAHIDCSQALGFAIDPDFEELESRKKAAEQIVDYLKDPSVKMVGMYGMGGTGKTTLAKKIGVQLYEDGTFRYVVKIDVSNNKNTDLIHIQERIAALLNISFINDKDVTARAKQLREQLGKNDKVLIILDDIWSRFELRDVGIPLDRELKVLITSRDVNLMNDMNSRHNVPLDFLSPDDSWKLFDRMADGVAPDRYSTARDMVEQCGGILVLLVTIARTLRRRDLGTWNEALLQLKRFEGDKYVEDGYKRIEVSYNFLPNDELRSLFLLCAQLNHRSIPIDDLLKYTMGLDLFKRRKKLREVRDRLYSHLGDLKGYCLLQDGEMEGTVRMHDVVHKFAAFVAYRDHHIFITVAEDQLEEWPSKDELEQFSAISLLYCHLPPRDRLPVAFDRSKLESFLLLSGEYGGLPYVPDEFFIGMKELKLVDIRTMSLSPVLLSSLNDLVELRTLCLDYCELDDIVAIENLPMLQVLSLKGSTVSEIRSLGSSLKLLDLSDCERLQVIASGVFCNLTLLEDLRLGKSFDKWEPLQGCNSGSDHETSTTKKLASLREFKNLGNLINLDIQIPDPKTFPKDLVFAKLERFKVLIGVIADRYDPWYEIGSESLKVKLAEDIQLYEGIKVLMRKAKKLHLEEIQGVTSVSELFFPVGMGSLHNLKVVLPKLEELNLKNLKVDQIWDDQLAIDVQRINCCFQNLTILRVRECHNLSYLFTSSMVRSFAQLKELQVEVCESIEEIVATKKEMAGDEEEIIEFTQLRKLALIMLGRLISFYSSSTLNPIISSSQEKEEHNQKLPTSLFNKKVAFPNLEEVEIGDMHQLKMIWGNQLFLNLRHVTAGGFPNLTSSIFPASIARALKQLESLTIVSCENLKAIVSKEEEEDGGSTFVFPKLTSLYLNWLPELERFYGGGADISDWPSLNRLSAYFCDKLIEPSNLNIQKGVFSKIITAPSLKSCSLRGTNFEVCYNSLEDSWLKETNFEVTYNSLSGELELIGLSKMKHIWSERYADDQFVWIPLNLKILKVESCGILISLAPKSSLFQNLTSLDVTGCDELIKLVSSTTAKSLVNLTEMRVSRCDSLIEIVATYDDDDGEEASNNSAEDIVFGKLETLVLHSLRSLTSFTTNNCNFQFPSLEEVTVAECPNMEFFSRGALSTPKLSGVCIEERRKMWEFDLNSTVRQLNKAMNSTNYSLLRNLLSVTTIHTYIETAE